ncbi:hypothetical protein C0583_04455 [Candidatus Parcubacteria bacterium]|nr:MAG: hypothetical protein C0583_04455 [Candidatus Parcubacteria bacterium]
MPKIITYVECDCEKGRLKKFSETAFEVEQNRIFKSDEFWQCDHCKEIFHREISIDTRYNLNRPDIDSDYFE